MEEIQQNSTRVPFKVSARTAKLIGLENFSNEEGAIIELVKNTYDADAENCILVFDLKYKVIVNENGEEIKTINKGSSSIYIIDNGIGMTDEIISNQWMTIGTDDKLYDHTSEGGRVKTGAKGIGRFALNRLGLLTNMYTYSKEIEGGFQWLVDWRDFDRKGAVVSDVEAILTDLKQLDLKQQIITRFTDFQKLLNLLEKLKFESGTIIEISELNDDWSDEQLEKLFGNLEMLLPPQEQTDFQIDFFSTSNVDGFGLVKTAFYDDFDYKLVATYDKKGDKNLEIKITRNELDVTLLEKRYLEVFSEDLMKASPYQLNDFKEKTITIEKNLRSILSKEINDDLIDKVGAFDFTLYYLKNTISDDKSEGDQKKYPYKSFSSANRRSWLKKFGGVKIFRDEFRIRPYGEKGEDWLKLGERQSQSPGGAGQRLGGYRIRPNQISGTVNISRIQNSSFQDKSGREGIIENDVFDLFKNILLEIISFFEKDRNTIMFSLSELYKKKNAEAEARRKAQEEAEKIKREQEQNEQNNNESNSGTNEGDSSTGSNYSDRERILADGIKILTEENDKKDDEIRLLRSLASVGLIISSFAHEVKSLRSRLIPRTTFLLDELSLHLDEKSLDIADQDDNPFYMIRLMREEDTKLKHWLDYSLNTLKRDKRERTNLNFRDYFQRFKSTWSKALKQRNITIQLITEDVHDCIIRAFEVDMDSIFNNLLSNSMSALKGRSKVEKVISISWEKDSDKVMIYFSDNGKGLDNKYKDLPEEIFNLNESSKTDKTGNVIGTGLGLYIVKTIIEDYNNSEISIVSFEDGLNFKITFKTRK